MLRSCSTHRTESQQMTKKLEAEIARLSDQLETMNISFALLQRAFLEVHGDVILDVTETLNVADVHVSPGSDLPNEVRIFINYIGDHPFVDIAEVKT